MTKYETPLLIGILFALLLVFVATLNPVVYDASNPVESDGSLAVSVQDQTSPPVDFFFTKITGIPTSVATDVSLYDDYVIVSDATFCSVGDYLGMFNAKNESNNRAYFGEVSIVNGNNLSLDTPIDFNFTSGDTVACFSRNLNVDGSLSNQIFRVQVGGNASQCIDITRIMFSFITNTGVSLAEFGDIPSLSNGLVIRRVDGDVRNYFNVKNNGELANLCFDYDPFVSTNPVQGQDGAKFRCTFAGQEKHGVVIRLCAGDSLESLIQDDLTDILQLRIIAEGHYVVE